MAIDTPTAEAILLTDFRRHLTRTFLLDVIDGTYRFVARGEAMTTAEPPHEDLTHGLQAAIQQVEYVASRQLLRRERVIMPQMANGDGADLFVAMATIGDPWRLAILDAGASPAEITAITGALRQAEVLVYTIPAPARGVRPADWHTQHAAALALWRPDSVLVVTGASGATPENLGRMARLLKCSINLPAPERSGRSLLRPAVPVLVMASEASFTQFADQMTTRANLRHLPDQEPATLGPRLVAELSRLIDEAAANTIPGYEAITAWTSGPVTNPQRGAGQIVRYLAQSGGRRVALVDLDEATSIHVAWRDQVAGSVLAEVDLGLGAPNVLTLSNTANIRRWLPFEMSDAEVTHWALNRSLRPLTIANTLRDQLVEQAFAREALLAATDRLPAGSIHPCELIIGSHRLARWGTPLAAVPVLLDGIQPAPEAGAVTLALDGLGILPALGVLHEHEASAAVAVLEQDALLPLGTCLMVQGVSDGQRAVTGSIERAHGEKRDFEVTGGAIAVLPLEVNESAAIRVRLENRATLGAFRAGQTVQFEAPTHVRGGAAGLIIDARGKPLQALNDPRRRQQRLHEWLTALGVLPASGHDFAS